MKYISNLIFKNRLFEFQAENLKKIEFIQFPKTELNILIFRFQFPSKDKILLDAF
jgi:hypothetical protein